jgi:YggT family protein
MGALINFVFFVISGLLVVVLWTVFAYVISTWLVSFGVVNTRNRAVYTVVHFLEAVARPILRPIQRLIPPLGGTIDISPVLLLLIIQGTLIYLLPPLHDWLIGRFG